MPKHTPYGAIRYSRKSHFFNSLTYYLFRRKNCQIESVLLETSYRFPNVWSDSWDSRFGELSALAVPLFHHVIYCGSPICLV
ncbi:hypothetical protein SAMN05216332_104193 [Nitrosospira briensis]|nr:hypothetical protein SAMN05216332_104193 [Nitrosospira briensis]